MTIRNPSLFLFRRPAVLFAFLLFPACLFTADADTGTGAETGKYSLDLPGEGVEAAVKKLSLQSGLDVLVPTKIVRGISTRPVKGEYTAREALEIMLADTGLAAYQDEKTGVLTVRRKAGGNAASGKAAGGKADTAGAIEGVVYNSTNGLPLGRVKVTLKSLSLETLMSLETLTDDQGHYVFPKIPGGSHLLEVTYLGFNSQSAMVLVPSGKTFTKDFQLAREGASPPAQTTGDDAAVVQMERFTVVADQAMTAQALAMNEQRHASNIMNVVAFDELGGQGQENIGKYVRFMPGVVIMDDDGSIALGGFPAYMSSLQLDGGGIPGTGADTRTVALASVPMLNIERIEVSKVPTPDMPAFGLGGSMNIVTRKLLGMKKPSVSYQMYMNFNNIDGIILGGGTRQATLPATSRYLRPSFNVTAAVPLGRRAAFSVGVSETWYRRPTDDTPVETASWNLLPGPCSPGDPDHGKSPRLMRSLWEQQAGITTTENIQAGIELKLSRLDTLTVSAQRRDTSEKLTGYGNSVIYGERDNAVQAGAAGGPSFALSNTTGRFQLDSRNNYANSSETLHATLQYQHLGPRWRVEARGSYSEAARVRDGKNGGALATVALRTPGDFLIRGDGLDEGGGILPNTYTITKADGSPADINPYDADDLNLWRVSQVYGQFKTTLASGRFSAGRVFSPDFSFKAGGAYDRMVKDERQSNDLYEWFDEDGPSARLSTIKADYGYDLVDDAVHVRMTGNDVRWPNPVKAGALFHEHPEWFVLRADSPRDTAQNSKRMIEAISAGFLRLDFRLLEGRMRVTTGLRHEKTKLEGWSMFQDSNAIYQRDPGTGELVLNQNGLPVKIPDSEFQREWEAQNPGQGWAGLTTTQKNIILQRLQYQRMYKERAHYESQSYDGFYPSLNITHALAENLLLRLAYARTIGRPDVKYVVAGITIPDPLTADQYYHVITVGNPGLQPWTADSFHLSLDTYNVAGGHGSIGVYRKFVSNFFRQRSFPATDEILRLYDITGEDRAYLLENDYRLTRWENVGDGWLTGIELSYRQTLNFLPSWLKSTQVWVNYTRLDVGGENTEEFIGFTPDVFSCGLNFIRPRYSVRLACSYQAETRKSRDDGATTTTRYQEGTYTSQGAYTKYSVTAEYALSRAFSLFLNWDNVFSKDRLYYRRGPDTPVWASRSQRQVMPSTIMIGAKGSF